MYRLSLLLSSSPDTAILAVILDVIITIFTYTPPRAYCTCLYYHYGDRKFARFRGEF